MIKKIEKEPVSYIFVSSYPIDRSQADKAPDLLLTGRGVAEPAVIAQAYTEPAVLYETPWGKRVDHTPLLPRHSHILAHPLLLQRVHDLDGGCRGDPLLARESGVCGDHALAVASPHLRRKSPLLDAKEKLGEVVRLEQE